MNTPKHTPGPWAMRPDNSIETKAGETVACFVDNEQYRNLIAAAPAMYEALKLALAWSMDGTPDSELSPIELGMRQAAEAALAQAEGRG